MDLQIKINIVSSSQKGEVEYRLMLDNKVVGYLRMKQTNLILTLGTDVWRLMDNDIMTREQIMSKKNINSIDYIVVPEHLRRQGYASTLMAYIINSHNDEIYMYVEPNGIDYDVLIQFYNQYNFRVLCEWSNYGNEKRSIMYRPKL